MQTTQVTTDPQKLVDTGKQRAYISIQLQGPGTLYYGSLSSEITSSSTDPTQQKGFTIIQADGVQRFWHTGELWVVASAAVTIAWDVKYF